MKLQNYIQEKWINGLGTEKKLYDAVSGEFIGSTSTKGIDFKEMLNYSRSVGGPNLRKYTFHERGRMIKALALHLYKIKNKFYELSYRTGATKSDSWIDIEGGIGNLFSYASLRKEFPDNYFYVEGNPITLSKNDTFIGQHICVPKEGVAIHINAFNFPIWGMLEKIAVNLFAGVPAIVKPATITSYLTECMFKEIIKSKILPSGSLQLVCGSANGILEHVNSQDVVTFTGSAKTGKFLKLTENIIENSVPFNMEADSLNSCILGTDVEENSEDFKIFIKEVVKEMTVKAGQKCTAIRRILVPENKIELVVKHLKILLNNIIIGNPKLKEVNMGSLAGIDQKIEVTNAINFLNNTQEIVSGNIEKFELKDAEIKKGSFLPPILFLNTKPLSNTDCHNIEPFGPVCTIMPYKNLGEVIEIIKLGMGSLVCSIITSNSQIANKLTIGCASNHGRILILNKSCAKESTGHGSPLPLLVHGGPGRAGGGEEMGGKRGVLRYLQRTAIQGHPNNITKLTNVFQKGSDLNEKKIHVFRKHFEELEIGETVFTQKRTITEADIIQFSNVSWDHFYAHTDISSLGDTIFEERVAHGYFILSAAAGLFVDGKKGPVLLNYGIDECRFTKPVYAGSTIGVKFTVKEKIDQETKPEDKISKGIVKFLVDVYDEKGETVAIATILTMIKKLNQKI